MKMVEFIKNIDPLIIDVVFLSILVLITVFGALRGIKNASINLIIFIVSLLLGFSPYTNSLKEVFTQKYITADKVLPAGSSNNLQFSYTLLTNLLASIIIFLLFYVILQVIKVLIKMIIKRRRGPEPQLKSKIGRVFSALISLIFYGSFAVVVLLMTNNNIIGMKTSLEKTTVTKFLVNKSEELLKKENVDKLTIKVYQGNVFYKVNDELMDAFDSLDSKIDEMINNDKYLGALEDENLSKDEAKEIIKERIYDIYELSIISMNFDDSNDKVKKEFVELSEEWITMMNREFKNSSLEKITLTFDEYTFIRKGLKDAGVSDNILVLYDEMVEGN